MRGSGLRRYTPDPQGGGGWTKEIARDIVSATTQGFQKEVPNWKKGIKRGYAAGKGAATKAVKKKADELVTKRAKRALNDLFGS